MSAGAEASPKAGSARWKRLPHAARELVASQSDSVLLETGRFDHENRYSYIFLRPVRVLIAERLEVLPEIFAAMERATAAGRYVAGYLGYECGYHFEPATGARLMPSAEGAMPLAWFGVYEQPWIFDHAVGIFVGDAAGPERQPDAGEPEAAFPVCDAVTLEIPRQAYCAGVLSLQESIAAGETYQANFTDRVSFKVAESPAEIYAKLLRIQPVAYAAMLNIAGRHVLSLSPELFFRREGERIVTRPMKGTMPRGLDVQEDAEAAVRLQNDVKNRSEHVMIVDLLRNDLGRLCTMGSVQVEDLFTVERYQTLLQMTSTVSGRLRAGVGWYEIFRSLFPSGSITGAPKIRTMQLLRGVERGPRGIYTGSIGFFAPEGRSVFNVAIRTLVMEHGRASMGVGGGIVADSDPEDEYRECLLKASFLTRPGRAFCLIETLLWDRVYMRLDLHLERLQASAEYFGFRCDRDDVLVRLTATAKEFASGERYRVRLLLDHDGEVTVTSTALGPAVEAPLRVCLSNERVDSCDVFLRHKTTQRDLYEREYAAARAAGFDEVIFLNERGEVTEGAISNLFVQREGKLLTPPLACGVLPGVFRRYLFETRRDTEEHVLRREDLLEAEVIFLCNSVRGMRRVQSLAPQP